MRWFAIRFALVLLARLRAHAARPALVGPWMQRSSPPRAPGSEAFDDDAARGYRALQPEERRRGVSAGCNGIEAMLVLVAGMLAYPATWRQRAAGIAIGAMAIRALNLARVVSLFYLGQWNREWFSGHLYGRRSSCSMP
jgi:exosortase/archaeosortase family protein